MAKQEKQDITIYFDGTESYAIKGGVDEIVNVDYFCDNPSKGSHAQFLLSNRIAFVPGRRYRIQVTEI